MTTCQLTKIEQCDGYFRSYYLTTFNDGTQKTERLIIGAIDAAKLSTEYNVAIQNAAYQ